MTRGAQETGRQGLVTVAAQVYALFLDEGLIPSMRAGEIPA